MKALLYLRAKELAKNGTSQSTREQTSQKSEQKGQDPPKTGLLQSPPFITHAALCNMTLSDERASLMVMGRCNDSSDNSIASSCVAEALVVNGTGRMKSIDPVTVQVALWQVDAAQKVNFSRSWYIPPTTLHL